MAEYDTWRHVAVKTTTKCRDQTTVEADIGGGTTPEELAATLKRDFARAAALIKAAGIQPE